MSGYREYLFWSPMLGGNAARVSMADARGSEYYMIVPNPGGRAYREARLEAVEAIVEAIETGCEPGEVRVLP